MSDTPAVALDLMRLLGAPTKSTPRGIDRVDLAYAHHYLETWPGECVAMVPTPWGARSFDRQHALRALAAVDALWRESIGADEDPAYARLKARLTGGPLSPVASPSGGGSSKVRASRGFATLLGKAGFSAGKPPSTLPPGTVYINVGQHGLAVGWLLRWLDRRRDVKPVFMLHDVIPLEHPEFVTPQSRKFHEAMVASTARYAKGLIVTTQAAERSVRDALAARGRQDIAAAALPLPVDPGFLRGAQPDPDLAGTPYFVVLGAIDPRKNHLLLLNVWRELVRAEGDRAPKLVIVGSRWRPGEAVLAMLDRSREVRDHVIEVSGLSTPALCRLLAGARALLMPSFAEGFGLPIIEALATGTPVVASDIPAHREAGGSHAAYLNPIDGLGWLGAVREHADPANDTALRGRAAGFKPFTWAEYFEQMDAFVRGL
jgi:glycosyltransferase involved in cell wall biosynthesis